MKQATKSSGLATAGMVLGIIAVALSAIPIINNFAFVLAVLAVIFGIVVLVQSKKGNRASGAKTIAAIVLGVVGIVIVFASQAFYTNVLNKASDDIDKVVTELEETSDKASGNATEELLANDVSVNIGSFTATTGEYGIVTTELPLTVTNKNSEKKSYSVQVEAVDQAGKRIAEGTVYANELGTGQSQTLKAFEYVASENLEAMKIAAFKIVSVSQY